MSKHTIENKVEQINTLLQEINDELGQDTSELEKSLKIRFPRGYIRTASHFRSLLKCINDPTLKSNIAYQLMLSDLFSWLLNRTDIFGTVKEMIIKYEIAIMASIAETLSIKFDTRNKGYIKRIESLLSKGHINAETKEELIWLWEIRKGIHLFELEDQEFGKYKETDFDRSVFAVRMFISELNANCA